MKYVCLLFDIMNANAKIMLDFKRNTIIGKMTILLKQHFPL